MLRDRSKGIYFVAEIDTTPIGQLLITYEWSDWRNGVFWWIQSVYIAPEHRSRGVFTALLDHVRRLAARQRNVCGLRLYMESGNSIARRVYQKRGMRNAGYEVFEIDFVAHRRKD